MKLKWKSIHEEILMLELLCINRKERLLCKMNAMAIKCKI